MHGPWPNHCLSNHSHEANRLGIPLQTTYHFDRSGPVPAMGYGVVSRSCLKNITGGWCVVCFWCGVVARCDVVRRGYRKKQVLASRDCRQSKTSFGFWRQCRATFGVPSEPLTVRQGQDKADNERDLEDWRKSKKTRLQENVYVSSREHSHKHQYRQRKQSRFH